MTERVTMNLSNIMQPLEALSKQYGKNDKYKLKEGRTYGVLRLEFSQIQGITTIKRTMTMICWYIEDNDTKRLDVRETEDIITAYKFAQSMLKLEKPECSMFSILGKDIQDEYGYYLNYNWDKYKDKRKAYVTIQGMSSLVSCITIVTATLYSLEL